MSTCGVFLEKTPPALKLVLEKDVVKRRDKKS